ncbi:hypothetical protein FEM48_Zijuj01G0248600 [Ziziphus jujuba var. spinosa]|uniref:Retrovirus-related Pol polyprotein from transposon TNT 1-94-like beta-barrel domain-containing protein n=1 Tax=Ziziphus jujuba var. spinosa TaxID=714518 RepID=A0A978W4K4_ZIZJJ|nr:hypothetical protein FEM48_Zijuj01G0248600 [Ziziphus jujuba var. spinosa]
MAIANKMRIHGEKLEDVTIVEKILRSMTVKFNFVVCSIEESKDIDTLSIDELQSSLLVHEQKLSKQDQEEQVLQAETKGVWHDKECRTNLIKDRGQRSERSNFAEKEEEISLLMVSHIQEETNENLWYLDIGCSNHMCGVKSAFSDLDESFRNTIKFGDNSTVSVMGKERVSIQTKRNSTLSIPDVLYVPDLKSNLLSVGQLQEKGYEISIKDVNFDSEDEGDKGEQATLEFFAEIQNIPDIPQRNQVTTATQLDVAVGSRPQRHRKRPAWMTNYESWWRRSRGGHNEELGIEEEGKEAE